MRSKFAVTKGRMIGLICGALVPAAAIGFGGFILTKGVVFNLAFAITYVLLPLFAAGLLALCIFSGCKPLPKAILSGAIVVLFVMSFLASFSILGFTQVKHYKGKEATLQYPRATDADTLMPELSEIGQPSDMEYHNVLISMVIFSAETDYLICCYTPEEYAIQKARLETGYTFQTETVTGSYSNCEASTEVDGYQFRLLSLEEYKEMVSYPKRLILIGYSDDVREIVYVSFYDSDLDYISSLKDFIIDDCGWKHVR